MTNCFWNKQNKIRLLSVKYIEAIQVVSVKDLSHKYKNHSYYNQVLEKLEGTNKVNIHLNGLSGSSFALFSSNLLEKLNNLSFFILTEKEEAAYFYNDLLNLIDEEKVLFFPSSYKRAIQYGQTDDGNIILRTHVLNKLDEYHDGLLIIVAYPEAISEKVISRSRFTGDTLQLHIGEKVSIDFIKEVLDTYQFDQVDFVYGPGQYAVRGGIVDIFSFSAEYPFRIDFFGDEVESIRSFELESQLSKTKFEKISILPNILNYSGTEVHQSVFEFIANKPLIWSNNLKYIAEKLSDIENSVSNKASELLSENEFMSAIVPTSTVEFGTRSIYSNAEVYSFNANHQPLFQKNFDLLGDNLLQLINDGYETYILSDNEKQISRLTDIFKDTLKGIPFQGIGQTLHEGFVDSDLKLCCYTDHQIFDRYHKYRINQYFSAEASVSLNELKDLKPGDYVVHIDHGIGKFGGLEKIVVNGKVQEAIKLVYRDNDVLYVNIHSLHRISKYKGKDDSEPKIYKLGSGAWQKLKQNTKSKVKDIAKDLIALYAKRKAEEGFRFSADTYMQEELEASFIYEDTPDQTKAIIAVKGDMESGMPMDRLVCGDVGFGKTEVAVRAAFKAVSDNKQVAILVPTTILALQHYNTFKDRLKDFPCKVDYISRLRKISSQTATLKEVENGKVDILIGTHRLLGKDIKFKDLGLLIIDEEQKFGVAAKEKLKALRVNIDTLTLTATPIPRTLQFSLMGARDLSVINTPPPNRHPIVTEVHTFNESIITEGINFELSRGGQVFFIHNRIQNIFEVETLIKKLCPRAKTIVGHGQLDGPRLEQTMIDFINGDYDVLVATAIIESGLDIPNANTIFINNAQNFGLSDLHQLRGRVGRSNRKAFCYLLAPPVISLTTEARRRLKAIEEFSDLGSGFNISLQDLDIRGAGNMLGAEQSGFIADIGFETYNRILNEAMQELRETEFKGLFDKKENEPEKEEESSKYVADCSVDTDLEIHIPDEYITNIAERIRLYRQLDSFEKDEQLDEFRSTLIDRFGPLPPPTEDLLRVVRLRWLAQSLGFEKIVLKNYKMIGYFVNNQDSSYFSSKTFVKILNFVQQYPDIFRMKENKDKLTLAFENIKSVEEAYNMLNKMRTTETN
jgi:transcription-repair coupling factor (superfamily II helicase)